MAKNARKLAETTYDKSILCDRYVSLIADGGYELEIRN